MGSTMTGGSGPLMPATRELGREKMIVLVEIWLIDHADAFDDFCDEGFTGIEEKWTKAKI